MPMTAPWRIVSSDHACNPRGLRGIFIDRISGHYAIQYTARSANLSFKLPMRYNDHYGHQAGDECLRRIAGAVRSTVAGNSADLLARYGGEELVAVLVGRGSADVEVIA
jgi:hypothetical protein